MQNHHQQHHGWLGGEVLPAEANQKKHQDDFWLHPWASLRLDTFSSGQGFRELKFRLQDFFVNSSDFYHQMALTGHVSIKFTPWMFRKIVFCNLLCWSSSDNSPPPPLLSEQYRRHSPQNGYCSASAQRTHSAQTPRQGKQPPTPGWTMSNVYRQNCLSDNVNLPDYMQNKNQNTEITLIHYIWRIKHLITFI